MKKKLYSISILLLLLLLAGCNGTKLSTSHQDSGINNRFIGKGKSFAEYINASRSIINQARTDLTVVNRNVIVNGNLPFELKPDISCSANMTIGTKKPYRRGVLLVHGLSSSPYLMKPMGDIFAKKCFRVMAVLLPGHGTRSGDLLHTTWEEWDKAVKYGINQIAKEADEVYIAGYSVGGALAIHESLIDTRIRGLFLFSPAIKVTSWAAITKVFASLGEIFPRLQWASVARDTDPFRYESVAMNAGYQVHRLTKVLQQELKAHSLNIPVFLAFSDDDATADSTAMMNFFIQSVHSINKRMIIYTTQARVVASKLPATNYELVNSAFPNKKITSSAHTAILTPPHDDHYGVDGKYASCIHYEYSPKKYLQCKERPDSLGEISFLMNEGKIIRRLMFNPNFEKLKRSINHFIASNLV